MENHRYFKKLIFVIFYFEIYYNRSNQAPETKSIYLLCKYWK